MIVNIVFVALFYRHARALWIGTSYMTGGIYADPDEDREWERSEEPPKPPNP